MKRRMRVEDDEFVSENGELPSMKNQFGGMNGMNGDDIRGRGGNIHPGMQQGMGGPGGM